MITFQWISCKIHKKLEVSLLLARTLWMLPRVLGFLYAICDLTYATVRSVICALGLVTLVIILCQYMFMINHVCPFSGQRILHFLLNHFGRLVVFFLIKLMYITYSSISLIIFNNPLFPKFWKKREVNESFVWYLILAI